MRNRLASLGLIACIASALVSGGSASDVHAQPKDKDKKVADEGKDAKKARDKKSGGKEVLDLDEEDAGKDGGKKAADDDGETPAAGNMTEEGAQAKRLFDNARWADAALALQRVVNGETGDDEGNKQIAQYH